MCHCLFVGKSAFNLGSALLPADKQCRVSIGNPACPPQAWHHFSQFDKQTRLHPSRGVPGELQRTTNAAQRHPDMASNGRSQPTVQFQKSQNETTFPVGMNSSTILDGETHCCNGKRRISS